MKLPSAEVWNHLRFDSIEGDLKLWRGNFINIPWGLVWGNLKDLKEYPVQAAKGQSLLPRMDIPRGHILWWPEGSPHQLIFYKSKLNPCILMSHGWINMRLECDIFWKNDDVKRKSLNNIQWKIKMYKKSLNEILKIINI